ncbi:retrotransposon protein, putative, ty1-copia subclass, partial [Tanacetum coccineum]
MAAQNTNNTTIRSEGKLAHLPLIPLPYPVASQAARDAYKVLYDAQNKVACLMLGSMSPELHRAIENNKAYDMIQELRTMFEEQAKQELFETVKVFYACKHEEGQSASSYLLKMKSYLDLLKRLGYGLRRSKKLKHRALSLYMGNGIRAAVEIKAIRSDRGGEYLSHEFVNHMKSYGIVSQLTPPYTPQHNGVSERRNQTLLDMVRSMMNLTTLPKSFWGYALESAARILNMVPTKKVERTPYEIWHGKAPKLSYLRVWGCYPKETMGYYFYYPPENKIFVAQNAEFFENSLIVQEASGSHGPLKMSGSDEGLELIQEEDTQPSENTSEEHNEVVPMEVEPQNVKVPIRRSARIPQAPDRYGFYVDVDEYELGDLNEFPNYKAALSDVEYDKWIEFMNTEMQSMKDNQVWILVELPPNGRTIGSKWLFKKKTDMDGNVHTFKARRVVKGYTQTVTPR